MFEKNIGNKRIPGGSPPRQWDRLFRGPVAVCRAVRQSPYNKGFTLLEIVITLIVASILGAILVEFLGTNVQKSYEPVRMAQEGMALSEIIEKIDADYRKHLMVSADPLLALKSDIEGGNNTSNTPYYGDYNYQTRWIKFVSGSEADETGAVKPVLKVIITHGNHSVTALYTK